VNVAFNIQVTDIFAPKKLDDTGAGDIEIKSIEYTVGESDITAGTVNI
jgi:hypothetical protein